MSALKRLFNRDDPRRRAGRHGAAGLAIRTERLHLRAVADGDVRRIAQLAGDWSIASMTARIPFPYTERDAAEWIGGLEAGESVAAVVRDDDLIGMIGYTCGPDRRSAEIGYWIGRPYWGHGYATEAARAVVAHCFEVEAFDRLTCCHFIDNPGSQRVIEKLGFTPTGTCSAWSEARRREAAIHRYELAAPPRRWRWMRVLVWRRALIDRWVRRGWCQSRRDERHTKSMIMLVALVSRQNRHRVPTALRFWRDGPLARRQ